MDPWPGKEHRVGNGSELIHGITHQVAHYHAEDIDDCEPACLEVEPRFGERFDGDCPTNIIRLTANQLNQKIRGSQLCFMSLKGSVTAKQQEDHRPEKDAASVHDAHCDLTELAEHFEVQHTNSSQQPVLCWSQQGWGMVFFFFCESNEMQLRGWHLGCVCFLNLGDVECHGP